jgi:hypothetical protein
VAPALLSTTPARAALTISAAASSGVTCSAGLCTTASDDAVLNVNLLEQLLSQGDLKVESGSAAQDIVVAVEISWSGGNALTLDAYRSLTITAPIAVTGSGGLALLTNDGGSGGSFVIGQRGQVTFAALTNSLSINGKAYTLVGNIATLAADITARPGGYYALAESYDASADGSYATAPVQTKVLGTVEGLGNTISNLTIAAQHGKTIGLFGTIGAGGTVRDLALTSVNISNAANNFPAVLGALAGTNTGSIIGCYADGVVTPSYENDAGGLVGSSEGPITSSEASVTVAGPGVNMGGLVGDVSGGDSEITDSFSRGAVSNSNSGGKSAGGLVGNGGTSIVNSYSSGRVTGDGSGVMVGGLLGNSDAYASDSYWDTTTSGTTKSDGGTGLTNSQLQSGLPAGFDPTIWAETPGVMGGLPYLLTLPR